MSDSPFVISSEIPFSTLRDRELEECMYWLLDAMGAKDLEWRVGGTGAGAPDQGRDLEAIFYVPTPDGEVIRQKWWVDAKGRAGTVEKNVVQKAVLNVQGRTDVDILVIATNTTFSNPTRDWVRDATCNRPRPVVRLWDKTDLERLLSKHPTAVLRVFSKALSPHGRLEVIRYKLWNLSAFADVPTLREMWKLRALLRWDCQSRFAVLVSEFANGNLAVRPWTTMLNDNELARDFINALANIFYLASRADDAGVKQFPYIRAVSHLLLACLDRFSSASVNNLIDLALTLEDGTKYPDDIRNLFVAPVLDQTIREMRDVCTADCSRVSTDKVELSDEEGDQYWARFRDSGNEEDPEAAPRDVLTIERHAPPCKVGFNVSEKIGCPLIRFDDEEQRNYAEVLNVLGRVVKFRKKHAFRTGNDEDV